jgi:internalin A
LKIYVEYSPVAEVSPIFELTNLKSLSLGDLSLRDFVLPKALTKLYRLQLNGFLRVDLSTISRLKDLRSLVVTRSGTPLLPSLSGLKHLNLISLYGTDIKDLAPLAGVVSL